MSQEKWIKRIAQYRAVRVLIPATIALIAYGNWAAYINQGTENQVVSGFIEGIRAFTFTVIGNLMTETVWSLTKLIKPLKFRIPVASILTWLIMQGISFTIHSHINPETALQTIAPSLFISSIYVSLYTIGLSRVGREASSKSAEAKEESRHVA